MTSAVAMANPGIIIEQLFENIPTHLQTAPLTSGDDSIVSDNSLVKIKLVPSALAKKKKISPRESTISTTSPSTLREAPSASKTKTAPRRLSAEPLATSKRASPANSALASASPKLTNDGAVKFPITYDIAIAYFSESLTPFEMKEIQNYDHIYFLGVAAKKIQVTNASNTDLYDDPECFYRVVPHDHIAYRYEITEKAQLGKGTFGQVIKAFDHKAKENVAVKLVRNERIYLKQSRDELRILQVLRKQDISGAFFIVHVKEFFMFRSHMCISFELLGMNLYQVLKKNQYKGLGASKIMTISRCTLKCLELLYKNRIIHCDIKPENIMLKRNGDFSSVKVGDFGSSCYEQQQVYHYIQSRYYRAPEVMLGMRYGPAIDMWSLGCVLGELSSGSPIFVGKDEDDQLASIEEVLGKVPPALMTKTKVKLKGPGSGRGGPGTKLFSSIVQGDEFFRDFVKQMLEWDPQIRPSPTQILEHRWIKTTKVNSSRSQPQSGVQGSTKLPKKTPTSA